MPYYLRVLSPRDSVAPVREIHNRIRADELDAQISIAGPEDAWEQVLIAHPDGTEICQIERNSVTPGSLGSEEIQEFLEEIEDCLPESGARWLGEYLQRVRTIYAIQVLSSGADRAGGWAAITATQDAIRAAVGGIIQADGEGFSNEQGCHILWQFSDDVTGPWWMAVLQENEWAEFQMELGNIDHREAFMRGEVPSDVAR